MILQQRAKGEKSRLIMIVAKPARGYGLCGKSDEEERKPAQCAFRSSRDKAPEEGNRTKPHPFFQYDRQIHSSGVKLILANQLVDRLSTLCCFQRNSELEFGATALAFRHRFLLSTCLT